MIKLIKTKDETNKFDRTNVTFEIDDNSITLDDLVMEMNDFIKAIGYSLQDRYLDVVQDSSNQSVNPDDDNIKYHVVYLSDGDHYTDTYTDEHHFNEVLKDIQDDENSAILGAFVGEEL